MLKNQFWVLAARRDGILMPRWQQSAAAWVCGRLYAGEQRDRLLGRSLMVARVVDEQQGDLMPRLLDARLIHIDHDRMVLTGFERDELTQRDVGQTWVLVRDEVRPQGAGIEVRF